MPKLRPFCTVGEINKGETSVQVTGLKPGHFYNIRVIASTPANFSTLGQLIRLRTLPSSGTTASGSPNDHPAESTEGYESHEAAAVRPAPAQYESNTVPQMIKEANEGTIPSKRTVSGRRNSPASQSAEQSPSHRNSGASVDRNASEESIEYLTRKLDSKRQENQDLEKQIQEEEVQSKRTIVEMTAERDRLRQHLKEKEDGNADLRKQSNNLEKAHRQAQSKKAQTENTLNQKKAERQRMEEDLVKWDIEIMNMRQNTQDMNNEKADIMRAKDANAHEMREKIAKEQAVIRILEEDIHAKGVEIQSLEKDREQFSEGGDEEQQLAKQDRDNEEVWEIYAQAMQGELGRLWQTLQQVCAAVLGYHLLDETDEDE